MHVGYTPFYIFRHQGYLPHLLRHAAQSLFNFPTKCYVFHNFILFFQIIFMFYMKHMLKLKCTPDQQSRVSISSDGCFSQLLVSSFYIINVAHSAYCIQHGAE